MKTFKSYLSPNLCHFYQRRDEFSSKYSRGINVINVKLDREPRFEFEFWYDINNQL